MSTNNIGYYEELTNIIFQISSNTHLISSAAFFHSLLLYSQVCVGPGQKLKARFFLDTANIGLLLHK